MPELPEVETVRRTLNPNILQKTIKEVVVFFDKALANIEEPDFKKKLANETIEKINRRGKYLIFKLTNFDLISHLRMEGKYEYHQKISPTAVKHQILKFIFTDGSELIYQDTRKFGRFYLAKKGEGKNLPIITKLGVEPTYEQFLLPKFYQDLHKRKLKIKTLLLNQEIVVGLGNIYVDEVLWLAKIHPEQTANTIEKKSTQILHQAIIITLAKAIEYGGTTVKSYKNAQGEIGHFQDFLNVYGKAGKPCPRCQAIIEKIKINGRGTHFCPQCQKI